MIKIKNTILFILLTVTTISSALDLDLQHEPLFLNQAVPPALAITLDNSGSMGLGYMPDAIASWGTTIDNRVSVASADFNTIYYDPTIIYTPPINFNGTSFVNSTFTNARIDGYYKYDQEPVAVDSDWLTGRTDLSTNYRMFWRVAPNYATGNAAYKEFSEAGGGPGGRPAFYYTWNGPANATFATRFTAPVGPGLNEYTLNIVSGAAEQQNFANWYTYYSTRVKLVKAAISFAFVNFGPDFKIDWQKFHAYFSGTGNMKTFAGAQRTNFYDWLFKTGATSGTPLRQANYHAGELFTKGSPGDVNSPYYDVNFGDELACQQNFHIAISDGGWNTNSPADYKDEEDQVSQVFPPLADASVVSYNPSSPLMNMYAGSNSKTLADTAFYYWMTDLRPLMDNKVPTYIEDFTDITGATVVVPSGTEWWQDPKLFWNPSNDPASWQHMVNFNIGVGIKGALNPTTDLLGIRDGSLLPWTSIWTTGGKVDDVWHASLNSRGKYFGAKDPTELAQALNKVVSNIISRKGRASAGSVSSNVVANGSLSFKTGFDTSDWTGSALASVLNPDGSSGAVEWDAGCKLTGGLCPSTGTVVTATTNPVTRKVFGFDSGAGTNFDFKSGFVPSPLLNKIVTSPFLTLNPLVSSDDIINYVRGDRSNEIQNSGLLRSRRSILGDIIHSPAQVLRGPSASYDDDIWPVGTAEEIAATANNGYEDFRINHKNRNEVVLIGANDGMLHAFDAGISNPATGGDELWAYIPSSSFDNLAELADPGYVHTTFVDAAPFVRDAFIGGLWKTIALGGLRHGGKLFYALDLGGNPENVPSVLWEFSDSIDPDMGFSYAGGIITRVYDPFANVSKWVAFVPNGYSSTNNKSAMYAIDLESGIVLHKWLSPEGSVAIPNGMGPPVAADYVKYDSLNPIITYYSADQATDFVYAGDLHGNVYKFDAQEVFNPGVTNLTPADMLFDGSPNQPITTAPRVFTPDDQTTDVIITFGTGKYIETPDRAVVTVAPQYIIGLRDAKISGATYTLTDARIVEQVLSLHADNVHRLITNNPVSKTESWKIELPETGERMVNLLGRNNQTKVLFAVSIIPTGNDPCLPGGKSWFLAVDARTGSEPPETLLPGGMIGVFIDDLVLGFSIITTPGGNSTTLNIDTTGGGPNGDLINIDLANQVWGRKSWHRIILD